RVGTPVPHKAAHMNFMIRPAGKGAPYIDPKPILDGWKLLESTAVYRAKGKNILKNPNVSIGQILMMPKAQLEKKVLSDKRIKIYGAGRNDIRTGQINRRVLAALEFLAMSGLEPTVSCLRSGHSEFTSSGNVSEHASGNAVDISAINGISMLGHEQKGSITAQTVRKLMTLQGVMRPHQIISLLDLGGNTVALPDHYNHIHVGFRPMPGDLKKFGLVSLVPVLLVGLFLGQAIRSSISGSVVDAASDRAQAVADLEVQRALGAHPDPGGGIAQSQQDALDRYFQAARARGDVAHVVLRSRAGATAYSDNHSLIGDGST